MSDWKYAGVNNSEDWKYLGVNNSEELAQVHVFLMKKTQPEGAVYFRITVKEYAKPPKASVCAFLLRPTKRSIRRPPRLFL